MIATGEAAARARALRREIPGADDLDASTLLRRLCAQRAIEVVSLAADDPLLFGARALLDRRAMALFVSEAEPESERAALFAHELGHLELHTPPSDGAGSFGAVSFGAVSFGGREPELGHGQGPEVAQPAGGYHARDRFEAEANRFARELLLPAGLARRLFLDGHSASDLARRRGLPLDWVRLQLAEALLMRSADYPSTAAAPEVARAPELDPSQKRAAEHAGSPLLLVAGPGTGKTRTLVARIVHLIGRGVDPRSILALTFSNKAAAELAERLARALPETTSPAAGGVWTGTFHAFGLDLIRRHRDLLGRAANLRTVDRADAVTLLQSRLPRLAPDLAERFGVQGLVDAFDAISRAKDERIGPAAYAQLTDGAGRDVAELYGHYDQMLRDVNGVDFGDLVALPCELLEAHPHLRASVRLRCRHVLVDEYQDTNRASRDLLRALAGRGERLWVVGDRRQSIYRFRGASSGNLDAFAEDFPGAAVRHLDVSYRSTPEIIGAFEALFDDAAPTLRAHGDSGARPRVVVAGDPGGEAAALSDTIGALRRSGVAFRAQAVLCRTHAQLERMGDALASRGHRLLHLGPFFEREDVRDVLAIVAFLTEGGGGALLRLAARPDYAIPLDDALGALAAARALDTTARELLARLHADGDWTAWGATASTLSESGRRGLERLARDLGGLESGHSPWHQVTTFLFDRSEALRRVMRSGDPLEAAALYQALSWLRSAPAGGPGWPGTRLLERARLLARLGDERHLRQLPGAALEVDAVRLMTLHAAKGLEFEAVHIPGWNRGELPHRYRAPRFERPRDPRPASGDPDRTAHDADERGLAYVGLSRARRHLFLYRHRRDAAGRRRRPSAWLDGELAAAVDSVAAEPPAGEAAGSSQSPPLPPTPLTPAGPGHGRFPIAGEGSLDLRSLGVYVECPRRFLYSRGLDLRGPRDRSPGAAARRVLRSAIEWLRRNPDADADGVRAACGDLADAEGRWSEIERRRLAASVERLAAVADPRSAPPPALEIELEGITFDVLPTRVRRSGDVAALTFLYPGKSAAWRTDTLENGLILEASRRHYGTGRVTVEARFLGDGEVEPLALPQRILDTHLEHAGEAARGIVSGRFGARPDRRRCPRCAYFFLCPALPSRSGR
ncbi:MAG: UvrD-helicase domain-containing protein [Acidobacteriota bacterium]